MMGKRCSFGKPNLGGAGHPSSFTLLSRDVFSGRNIDSYTQITLFFLIFFVWCARLSEADTYYT